MQKGGEIVVAKNPRVTSLHGCEHVISLFFSDIAKLRPIKVSGGELLLALSFLHSLTIVSLRRFVST